MGSYIHMQLTREGCTCGPGWVWPYCRTQTAFSFKLAALLSKEVDAVTTKWPRSLSFPHPQG